MITFMEFLQGMETQSAVSSFLSSDAGKRVAHMDCKTVTRAFINWAGQNGIKARVILLVPPSPEMIKKHPEMGGKGGQGDAHIMPVVNNDAIDFTARQFGFPNTFDNPLITPIQGLKATYQPKGYFTDSPEWNNGKPFYIGPWEGMPDWMGRDFTDERL